MLKAMGPKIFSVMHILGCVALYISLYGNFAISGVGILLAVPVALILVLFEFRSLRLRGA